MGEKSNSELRKQLVALLHTRQAAMVFEDAVANFPIAHINDKLPQQQYSFWHLVEHLRITQRDILDYIRGPYQPRPWPEGYWPHPTATTDATGWDLSVNTFLDDRSALVEIVRDPATDLFAPIPWGEGGHNVLREVLIVGEHNAYHTGELAIMRGVLGLWPAT